MPNNKQAIARQGGALLPFIWTNLLLTGQHASSYLALLQTVMTWVSHREGSHDSLIRQGILVLGILDVHDII